MARLNALALLFCPIELPERGKVTKYAVLLRTSRNAPTPPISECYTFLKFDNAFIRINKLVLLPISWKTINS